MSLKSNKLVVVLFVSLLIWYFFADYAKDREQRTLTIFAASSLTEGLQEVARTFKKDHPGIKVQFNFAGSQVLLHQLDEGASAGVFVSADKRYIDQAVEKNLVENPRLIARNRLVAITAMDQAGVRSLADFVKVNRIALANPSVPVGRYTDEVINKLCRLYGPGFKSQIYKNVVSWESDVKQVVQKVAFGEVGGAIVYVSDINKGLKEKVRTFAIPEANNVVAQYYIAQVKGTANGQDAIDFIDLALSPRGQKILQRFGFLPTR